MFCPKCGAQNPEDVNFCSKCGEKFLNKTSETEKGDSSYRKVTSSENFMNYSISKRVNANLAILILVFGIVGLFLVFIPFGILLSSILGVVNAVLLVLLIFQWAQVLNLNAENTSKILRNLAASGASNSAELNMLASNLGSVKIDLTMYWLYLGFYVLSNFMNWVWLWGGGFLFNILSFIFLMVFLQNTFSSEQKLQNIKNQLYSYRVGKSTRVLNQIKPRNVGLLILFFIITFGIYWWYFLIKHSQEINDFLDADEYNLKVLR